MPEETINDSIQIMIDHTLKQQPQPTQCTITKTYSDNNHVDAETEIGTLEYIETIGNTPTINKKGIILYLNGDINQPIIIC